MMTVGKIRLRVMYGCTYQVYDFGEMRRADVVYDNGTKYNLDFDKRVAIEESNKGLRRLGFEEFRDLSVMGEDKLPSILIDFKDEKFYARIEN